MSAYIPTRVVAVLGFALLFLFTACSAVDRVRDFSGEQVARAVEVECALSIAERQRNLEAVNRGLAARGLASKATALDCDGDGAPDL